jgi:GH18 family chitinase
VHTYGFDGVDIDDEGINDGSGDANNSSNFSTFVEDLRSSLGSSAVITIAAQTYYPTAQYNTIKSYVNQINIMSYDLAGPYEQTDSSGGDYTWYNSPTKSGGNTVPGYSTLLPSADTLVSTMEADGIASSKLAIGTAFYGYDWNGATNIEQAFTFSGGDANWTAMSYASIIANKYSAAYYHHDTSCGAAYLGRTDTGDFIPYDDANVISDKISYIGSKSLGGLVCFEIGQQYTPSGSTKAAKNPLLTAIDNAL